MKTVGHYPNGQRKFEAIQAGVMYDIRFTGSPVAAQMHYKRAGYAEYGIHDYVGANSDGVYRFSLEAAGNFPGSTMRVVGTFRSGHSFKFKDLMKEGEVRFVLDDNKISIHTKSAIIPLENEACKAVELDVDSQLPAMG